ncbi:HD domain-containing protein [bacterium]|nr:HD domain-containing protein [bacterium]
MNPNLIEDLSNNQSVSHAFFLVQSREMCQKRNGEVYYRFILGDGHSTIKAVLWDNLGQITDEIRAGVVVKVQGSVTTYQNELQLTITRMRAATTEEASISDFLPRTERDPNEMMSAIEEIIDTISSPFLKELVASIFCNADLRRMFQESPAAKKLHHNMVGGLLEHTLSVTKICDAIVRFYPVLNRDILISAALLHDIGKVYELDSITFDYTDQGRLLGHLIIGAEIIMKQASIVESKDESTQLELLHAILAHHGTQEWGSPIVPMTLEAITLHYADNLDAKIVSFERWLKENPDEERQGWSRFWPIMQRHLYRRPCPDIASETRDSSSAQVSQDSSATAGPDSEPDQFV